MSEGSEETGDKTEEPTPRKLQKAREQGDVPSSKEAGTATMVLALAAITALVMPQIAPQLVGVLRRVIEAAGSLDVGEGRAGMRDVGIVMTQLYRAAGLVLAPVLGVLLLAALAGVALQGDTVVATERIRPKLSKLSPLSGLKKMFSPDALVEFVKSVGKVLVVGAVAVWIAYRAVTGIWQTEAFLPESLAPYMQHYTAQLLIIVAVFTAAVAVVDVVFKRMRWMKKQRMTIKQVRDEHKDQEGDPLIKGKRMEIRRKRARQRMAAAVPGATVVLTNPTHFAVALRYETGVDAAPVCVAKGADLMAARIRELARESEVPVVENRPLARALYDVAELDREIPMEHWQTVAEIIRYIMDLQKNIRRKPPEGTSLRDD